MRTGFFGSYTDGLPPERMPSSPGALSPPDGEGNDAVEVTFDILGNEPFAIAETVCSDATERRIEERRVNKLLG